MFDGFCLFLSLKQDETDAFIFISLSGVRFRVNLAVFSQPDETDAFYLHFPS